MSAAAQMLCGGIAMGAVGLLIGERVDISAVSLRSWTAFIYLIAFGSIVGFGAYIYLLKHSTMTRVSTYAFVNPIVAVALGWLIANEPIGPRTIVAGVLIVIAVILILRQASAPTLKSST
jgi:drug/metabolite transporter (DMT)-like permease